MSRAPVSRGAYAVVFAILLALTLLTVGASRLDLGPLNPILALTIAAAKALLVMLYFMHLRFGPRLNWLFAGLAFSWLGILIVIVISDYMSRDWPLSHG